MTKKQETGTNDFPFIQNSLMKIMHREFSINFLQIKKYGIHPRQIPILMLVSKNDGLSQIEISKRLKIKPSTVAVSIQRLEKCNLIVRKPDKKDQRVQRVYKTEELIQIAQSVYDLSNRNEKLMLEGFSDTEVCLLKRFLKQVYQNLENLSISENEILKEKRGEVRQ